jgi:hypothetical protein
LITKVEICTDIGNLPSSASTARLVDLGWTPKIRLQNFKCSLSISEITLKILFLNISIRRRQSA